MLQHSDQLSPPRRPQLYSLLLLHLRGRSLHGTRAHQPSITLNFVVNVSYAFDAAFRARKYGANDAKVFGRAERFRASILERTLDLLSPRQVGYLLTLSAQRRIVAHLEHLLDGMKGWESCSSLTLDMNMPNMPPIAKPIPPAMTLLTKQLSIPACICSPQISQPLVISQPKCTYSLHHGGFLVGHPVRAIAITDNP